MVVSSVSHLASALVARGLDATTAERIAEGFGDDGVPGALRIVERFDHKPNRQTGLLIRMLEQDPPPPEPVDPVERRHQQFDRGQRWALANGFTERQSPFAAMSYLMVDALSGPPPRAAQIRKRVKAQYPQLFEIAKEPA